LCSSGGGADDASGGSGRVGSRTRLRTVVISSAIYLILLE